MSEKKQETKTYTAFISGHTDILQTEFEKNYIKKLDYAVDIGNKFVMAGAFGADQTALDYLLQTKKIDPKRVTIYLHEKYADRKAKYEEMGLNVISPFATHNQRDEKLTIDSDFDIAWLRSDSEAKQIYGETWEKGEISSTEKNLLRRQALFEQTS